MANPIVKCTVDQCTHYMSGDQCMAAKVSIYNEEATGNSKKAKDTQCKSFHDRKTMGDMLGALHNANVGGTLSAAFMDGTQITPAVECFVNNCNHWHNNNVCTASQIDVFGANAANTDDTDCRTFERRD
jgi:hypothetical protein